MGKRMEERDADVLIVGAGPTGLQMAYLLAIQGISFHLIEKNGEPTTLSKALGIQARTREMWDALGLGGEVLQKAITLNRLCFFQKKKKIQTLEFGRLDTDYPFITSLAQADTEAMLLKALNKKNKEVLWGHEFLNLEQFEGGVNVDIQLPSGETSRRKYSWVIGCDGARSQVRKSAHIPFEGHSSGVVFGLADLEFDPPIPMDQASPNINKQGLFITLPMPDNKVRIIVDGIGDTDAELSHEDWERIIHDRSPYESKIAKMHWQSRFRVHFLSAKNLLQERVALCGDACHIHSPALAQGMNTGLQDAYNLAWKLGLKIHNRANRNLLESYNWEREKTAKELIRLTEFVTKIITMKGPIAPILRKLLIGRVFSSQNIRKKMARRILQLSINYRGSPICFQDDSLEFSRRKRYFVKGPKPGERAPNTPVRIHGSDKPETLYKYLQGYKHVALFFCRDGSRLGETTRQHLLQAMTKIQAKLDNEMRLALVVKDEHHPLLHEWKGDVLIDDNYALHKAYHSTRPCIFIIRPDGYIGYRSFRVRSFHLKRYLTKVFDIN